MKCENCKQLQEEIEALENAYDEQGEILQELKDEVDRLKEANDEV